MQAPNEITRVYFDSVGHTDIPIYLFKSVEKNMQIGGPAVIVDETQTIVVAPNAEATVLETCIIPDLKGKENRASREPHQPQRKQTKFPIDAVRLSIFSHRFMSIVEQMDCTVQETSVSTSALTSPAH
ncbi:uncharacterized protein Z518_10334 [Rhinocladiella mackenziei CBS 650.93]|uniref:Uncharacterized protein n=1 Tax=Rhinocladiella mackenziei CBS 650.93 TaxID=1442369 RepID=A0A0D2IAC2_9EURO|nr:uncharacterized protein Z518_10334 [Rhinocladiella mackenziei CBS 650.93]KIX00196.1 hypothetical protein Z518_10334 [Rhinocladiella mackenziei CBS 650.93]